MDIRRIPIFAEISKPSIEVIKLIYANDLAALKAIDSQGNEITFPSGGVGGAYTYDEIPLTSQNIKDLASEFELLPAPAANEYYDIAKIIFEYTHVTTPYTLADLYLYITGPINNQFSAELITNSISGYVSCTPSNDGADAANEIAYAFTNETGQALIMTTFDGGSPTLGDGTLLVKLWYKIKTFGPEA